MHVTIVEKALLRGGKDRGAVRRMLGVISRDTVLLHSDGVRNLRGGPVMYRYQAIIGITIVPTTRARVSQEPIDPVGGKLVAGSWLFPTDW
jgi:hypothetical protein